MMICFGECGTTGEKEENVSSGTQTGFLGPVPPPLPPPGRTTWTYIERQDMLARVAESLRAAMSLAVDVEFVQVRDRGPQDPAHKLALLQLAAASASQRAYVFDPLRLSDLSPLQAAFEDTSVLKLFHGIGADAQVLATRGLTARHTLDLEAVSRSIFGTRESSLRSMLQRACGVRLDKSLQRSDWMRRPLTPAMLAYAARDADMTLVLYSWLRQHYPWAIALHEMADNQAVSGVAAWILPFLESARPQRADWAVAEAGLVGNHVEMLAELRGALSAVQHPAQRARIVRLIAELDLAELAPDMRPLLEAPAADVRAAAARSLGRLRDQAAESALRALLHDPVQDVREACQNALDHLGDVPSPASPHRPSRRSGAATWTSGEEGDGQPPASSWQAALLAQFGTAPAAGDHSNAVMPPSVEKVDDPES
jgi:hypothetical protein